MFLSRTENSILYIIAHSLISPLVSFMIYFFVECETMRLDKYLKVSRILKRRTVSKELALHERIQVNGKTAKPSCDVKVGDVITITFGNRQMSVKVMETREHTKKEEASIMYEVLEEKFIEEPLF